MIKENGHLKLFRPQVCLCPAGQVKPCGKSWHLHNPEYFAFPHLSIVFQPWIFNAWALNDAPRLCCLFSEYTPGALIHLWGRLDSLWRWPVSDSHGQVWFSKRLKMKAEASIFPG